MKHDDFKSIQVEEVIEKVLRHVTLKSKATGAHWISAHGLARVHDSSSQDWQWVFESADIVGKHVMGSELGDLWAVYKMWKDVLQLYPTPWKSGMSPHFVSIGDHAAFACPLSYNGEFLGMLLIDNVVRDNPLDMVLRLRTDLEIASKYVCFAYQHLHSRDQSYVDELTGLYNQRYLPTVLEHEVRRAAREKSAFSVLFLDIDYFKMVNDTRGHWVGSKLLCELGEVLKSQVRSCDYAFRYGGDEFIVVLGGSGAEDSKRVAERIRQAVEEKVFHVEGQELKLTVSIGLAAYPEHAKSASELIQLADQAMYYGKRKSRNIVFVAG